MEQYHSLVRDILANGDRRGDRTGVGTIAVFGRQLRFDLKSGFPAITTKKLAWRGVVGELLWFIEGSGDERRLAEITHGTRVGVSTIWTPNAQAPYWKPKAKFDGDLGRVYGVQWRRWRTPDSGVEVDQLIGLIDGLRKDPNGRRHIISAWNPGELGDMALPPCHVMCQFFINSRSELSCHMYQRSVDVFLGLPFNIASYALLTHLVAKECGLGVDELVISTGDTHIYIDHIKQVEEQICRDPYPAPSLWLNPAVDTILGYTVDDIKLENYKHHEPIKAKMAV